MESTWETQVAVSSNVTFIKAFKKWLVSKMFRSICHERSQYYATNNHQT